MQAVRVAADRWNFELAETREPIVPLGGNMLNDLHPVQGTLFDNFDANDCDRRFAAMAEVGLNVVRQAIGVNNVFDPATGLKAEGMKNWDTFVKLAEKHGIYLMPVGGYVGSNDWFDVESLADHGKSLDESCAFWEAFVGHYSGHPAFWAWDLRNELLYDEQPHDLSNLEADRLRIRTMLMDRWPAWLKARYETVANMNQVYGSDYAGFEDVPGSVRFVEKPWDIWAYDFRCYLNERGYDWCKRQCDVIRSVSPNHMICSGNNGCFSPDQDLWLANGFHNHAIHELFDFVTFHPYPALQAKKDGRGDPLDGGEPAEYWLNACVGMARLEWMGKPIVVQEFGWYGGGESSFIGPLPYRSENEHADYMRELTSRLVPHTVGFINWPTMDMPNASDISNHGGIFTHDAKPKELAKVYGDLATHLQGKKLKRAAGTSTLSFSLLGLYTSRGYQDRMWDEICETIAAEVVPDIRLV